MKYLSRLVLVLLATTAGCTSDAERASIIADFGDVIVCCGRDDEFPIEAGEFLVQVFQAPFEDLDPDTVQVTLTTELLNRTVIPAGQHARPDPVRLSEQDGATLRLGSNTIEIIIDDCEFTRVDVEFVAEVTGRRISDRTLQVSSLRGAFAVVNTCPPTGPGVTPPQVITETILGAEVPDFARYSIATPTDVPTANPNSQVAPQVPPLAITETFEVGALVADLDATQLRNAFTGPNAAFPLGRSDNGLTLQGEFPLPMQPGRYLLAWQCVREEIPLEPDGLTLQYALVFDRDGDPANDYQGTPPFDRDFFNDTDTWLSANFDSFSGWRAFIADAGQRPPFELDTEARIILQGQVQYFVMPLREFGDPALISARWTAFAHRGDFGFSGGEWSADATPQVGEPLIPVDLTTPVN